MYTPMSTLLRDAQKNAGEETLAVGGWRAKLARYAISLLRLHPSAKDELARALHAIGYDTTDWLRVVMYRECFSFIEFLGPERLDVLEISGGPQWRRRFRFRSYTATEFPGFDICADQLPQPHTVTTLESGRARCRAATAVAAPVRWIVISIESIAASGTPLSARLRTMRP